MTSHETPRTVEVPLADLVEMAVEHWRFERWLARLPQDASAARARHTARRLARFLADREVKAVDLTGLSYEPGLAVEVLDTVRGEAAGGGGDVVEETVSPIVMWRGTVVKYGEVVVRQHAR